MTTWRNIPDEVWAAAMRAMELRVDRARIRGLGPGWGEAGRTPKEYGQNHVDGAVAEACFRYHMGLAIDPDNDTWKRPDAGPYEIKGSRCRKAHLIVRGNSDPSLRVVLVVYEPPDGRGPGKYKIPGWITARDAFVFPDKTPLARAGRFQTKGHWVPQSELHPIEDLIQGGRQCELGF